MDGSMIGPRRKSTSLESKGDGYIFKRHSRVSDS